MSAAPACSLQNRGVEPDPHRQANRSAADPRQRFEQHEACRNPTRSAANNGQEIGDCPRFTPVYPVYPVYLDPVADGGSNSADNLLALCPNCHTLHHQGVIPTASLRAWKMILLAVNEAYDRKSVDILLAFDQVEMLYLSGDGLLDCAPLVAGGLLQIGNPYKRTYDVRLSERGRRMIAAWKEGDQEGVVAASATQKRMHWNRVRVARASR